MNHDDDEQWEDVVDCPSCGTVQFDDEALPGLWLAVGA